MVNEKFVSKGAASFTLNDYREKQVFYFLLLPKLTMLAFSSSLEPLRIVNQLTQKEIYNWHILTPNNLPVTCSNGVVVSPDTKLENVQKNATIFICSGVEPMFTADKQVISWIRRQHRMGSKFGGICTGAYALAKAGIIGTSKFTLHWENQPGFIETFHNLLPTQSLFEIENNLITCGGGSAATDMMLHLIEESLGRDVAVVVADMCIHKRVSGHKAPQKSSLSVALGSRNLHLISAIQVMTETVEDPLPLVKMCEILKISRRQLERLFKRYTQQSPIQFYYSLRLERAHALLNETNMSITEIATATGFNSASHLSRQFKAKYNISPTSFRKGWHLNLN